MDKASLGRFVAGKQSIRLDRADKLAKHYALSINLEADFRRATGLEQAQQKAQQIAQQTAETSEGQEMTFTPTICETPMEKRRI